MYSSGILANVINEARSNSVSKQEPQRIRPEDREQKEREERKAAQKPR